MATKKHQRVIPFGTSKKESNNFKLGSFVLVSKKYGLIGCFLKIY